MRGGDGGDLGGGDGGKDGGGGEAACRWRRNLAEDSFVAAAAAAAPTLAAAIAPTSASTAESAASTLPHCKQTRRGSCSGAVGIHEGADGGGQFASGSPVGSSHGHITDCFSSTEEAVVCPWLLQCSLRAARTRGEQAASRRRRKPIEAIIVSSGRRMLALQPAGDPALTGHA